MAEGKTKIPLRGQVRLPEPLDREIDMEAARLNVYKYELIEMAWLCYKESGASQKISTKDHEKGLAESGTSGTIRYVVAGVARDLARITSELGELRQRTEEALARADRISTTPSDDRTSSQVVEAVDAALADVSDTIRRVAKAPRKTDRRSLRNKTG